MLTRYIAIFLIVGICLVGNLSLTHSVSAETLFQSTVETRLMIWLRVEQTELQKLLPAQWQVNPIPGGPFKETNFVIAFNDVFLVQDAQGKPDKGGIARKAVFVVPAKHTQTGEMASVVTGGLTADSQDVPGAYKNFSYATIRREQTSKVVNIEAGLNEDFWEVRDGRGNSETGFSGEIALGYRFTPNLAGEFGIGYSNTERDITFVSLANWEKEEYEIDVVPITLTLKAILPYKKWEFFGLGGGGVYFVFAELRGNAVIGGTLFAYDRNDNDAVMGAYVGAGIHYHITPTFFVGVEGKYLWTDDVDIRDEILGVHTGRKFDMDGIIATAVIGFRF